MQFTTRKRHPRDGQAGRGRADQRRGQSMVEFMLILPLFIIHRHRAYRVRDLLQRAPGVNFASRDAALLAAEAAADASADCRILRSIESYDLPPVERRPHRRGSRVLGHRYRGCHARQSSQRLSTNGQHNCATGTASRASRSVPYTMLSAAGYPESQLAAPSSPAAVARTTRSTPSASRSRYTHRWLTPLANIVTLGGTGSSSPIRTPCAWSRRCEDPTRPAQGWEPSAASR